MRAAAVDNANRWTACAYATVAHKDDIERPIAVQDEWKREGRKRLEDLYAEPSGTGTPYPEITAITTP